MSVEDLKAPPHSIEAEQSVLGGLMLDNSAWDKVADLLTDDDFYRTDHGMLFAAVRGLADRQMPFDVVTLAEALDQSDQLDQAGGLPYLSSLVASTPSAANIAAYARIVRERSVVRKLIGVGVQIAEAGYNPQGREVPELLDTAERMVFDIRDAGARGGGGFRAVSELIGDAVERLDELYNSDSPITGLATGFTDFDSKTSGLQPGDLVIVAGRPSMGKTSFAMNLAEHAALRSGKAAAVFSMEMPAEQLVMRLIASLGRIDAHKLRTGRLDDQDWPRVTSATALLNEAKLYIDDTPALSPTDLRARARRLMRQEPLGLIVVDYLQLMQVVGSKENRATEISQISRDLKSLAKELGVPVVALSQLNRSLEQRPNKRPVMSDLRESGAIEQDADLIVFIYRDEVYNEETQDKGVAEIIIAKQRNGPIGTSRMAFLNAHTRFEDLASGYSEGYG